MPSRGRREAPRYVCQACGHSAPRWLGRCPGCGGWNTLVEEASPAEGPWPGGRRRAGTSRPAELLPVDQVERGGLARLSTGFGEFDRVLGGGLVAGSLVLLAGEPGVGKSTLLLGSLGRMAAAGRRVLYASGEESNRQVRLRAERLGVLERELLVTAENDADAIAAAVEASGAEAAVVDSIQSVYLPGLDSAPGSVAQVRESAGLFLRLAKRSGPAIILVGHLTKAGGLAGPKVLEHAVDVVLTLRGERTSGYRILQASKNRFGSTSEIGLFAMTADGLDQLPDASSLFLAERSAGVPGSVVAVALEGERPVLVEVQGLVVPAAQAVPRRAVSGFDSVRQALLLAVMEKRLGFAFGNRDAFLKVTGGLWLDEPAADLPVALALASSYLDRPVRPGLAAFGEVGLTGEVRAVHRAAERVREAERLGFSRCLVPARNGRELPAQAAVPVRTLAEAVEAALA
ncbi:MAG: DNA repair protein RadA [Bacillota bacterium]|nr:DNA repair protein RadA [Bacillota bacterium]